MQLIDSDAAPSQSQATYPLLYLKVPHLNASCQLYVILRAKMLLSVGGYNENSNRPVYDKWIIVVSEVV